MLRLDSPLEDFPRASKRILPALKRLGIRQARDLLFHFPFRYDDFSNRKKIAEIQAGEVVTVRGKIERIKNSFLPRRRISLTEAVITDESGRLKTVWFNQPFILNNLQTGDLARLSGKIVLRKNGLYLQNPAYEKIKNMAEERGVHTGGLVAIYPETAGLTSRWLRFLIKNLIDLRQKLPEILPEKIRRERDLPEIKTALWQIHFPKNLAEAERARRRFNFEELLLLQLHALKERLRLKQHDAPTIPTDIQLMKQFVNSLPFELTNAQRRSIWEIIQDLAKPSPMNRLLEGDVGSGKTVVAAAASLLAARAGYQTMFMAPTEILACQHYETLSKVLKKFEIKIGLLTGSVKKVLPDTEVFVGTHALLTPKNIPKKVGLVIVDEQHRFGVEQRAALLRQETRNKEDYLPHFLSMSATPIPRTLALTIFGDLDISLLDELPKFRKKIITRVVEPKKRNETYFFIKQEINSGRQVFVICPRIELPEEKSGKKFSQQKLTLAEVKAVKEEHKKLSEEIFPEFKVGMLHGKMKVREKEKIMSGFKNREVDVLVSTSVIEVGVDVPNATVILIEGAERFGLAQLHQFRGRVGRGAEQSYCFLFPTEDGTVTRRLRAMQESQNGFELAEKDLEIRGPGDVFGTKQWGDSKVLAVASSHPELVRETRTLAKEIIRESPNLEKYPPLKKRLEEIESQIHFE